MERKKRFSAFGGVLLSVIFGLILSVFTVLFVLWLFIFALNENAVIPDVGPISGDGLTVLLDSWLSVIPGAVCVLIPVLMIVFVHRHHIRRIFLTVGCSAVVSAVVIMVMAIMRMRIFKLLSAQWQEIIVNATAVFRNFGFVCAIILIAIGAAALSIFSCITVIRGRSA